MLGRVHRLHMNIGRATTGPVNGPPPTEPAKLVVTTSGVALLTTWVTVKTMFDMTFDIVAGSIIEATACYPGMFNVQDVLCSLPGMTWSSLLAVCIMTGITSMVSVSEFEKLPTAFGLNITVTSVQVNRFVMTEGTFATMLMKNATE